jgi:hypothetical protein
MVKLRGCAVGETPTFADILGSMEGVEDTLFEEWTPADSEAWVREHFPPFKWDGEETVEAIEEVGEPEYLGVHSLHEKQEA